MTFFSTLTSGALILGAVASLEGALGLRVRMESEQALERHGKMSPPAAAQRSCFANFCLKCCLKTLKSDAEHERQQKIKEEEEAAAAATIIQKHVRGRQTRMKIRQQKIKDAVKKEEMHDEKEEIARRKEAVKNAGAMFDDFEEIARQKLEEERKKKHIPPAPPVPMEKKKSGDAVIAKAPPVFVIPPAPPLSVTPSPLGLSDSANLENVVTGGNAQQKAKVTTKKELDEEDLEKELDADLRELEEEELKDKQLEDEQDPFLEKALKQRRQQLQLDDSNQWEYGYSDQEDFFEKVFGDEEIHSDEEGSQHLDEESSEDGELSPEKLLEMSRARIEALRKEEEELREDAIKKLQTMKEQESHEHGIYPEFIERREASHEPLDSHEKLWYEARKQYEQLLNKIRGVKSEQKMENMLYF